MNDLMTAALITMLLVLVAVYWAYRIGEFIYDRRRYGDSFDYCGTRFEASDDVDHYDDYDDFDVDDFDVDDDDLDDDFDDDFEEYDEDGVGTLPDTITDDLPNHRS